MNTIRKFRVVHELNGHVTGTVVTAENKAGARRAVGGTLLRIEELCPNCSTRVTKLGKAWNNGHHEGCPGEVCTGCGKPWDEGLHEGCPGSF